MNTGVLIPDPILDDRKERERIAQGLQRLVGENLTPEDAEFGEQVFRDLRALLAAGGDSRPSLLPKITSLRPGEPQYVLLTELLRLPTQMLFKMNQVPNKNRVAFLRLLNTEMIPETAATTTLRFTKHSNFIAQPVVIPGGTVIANRTGQIRVTTDEDLTLDAGVEVGEVGATSLTAGFIGRINPGVIGFSQSAIGGIREITNTTFLAGGRNAETVEQAIIRAREMMMVGEHLGSAEDYIKHILFYILRGLGRVVAFEFYRGDFAYAGPGYLLLAIQGEDGLSPTTEILQQASAVISQRHVAGIDVVARAPVYREFAIEIDFEVETGQGANELIEQAKKNILFRYDPLRFKFGTVETRYIKLSDIVGAVEAAGTDQISVKNSAGRFHINLHVKDADGSVSILNQDVPLAISEIPALTEIVNWAS